MAQRRLLSLAVLLMIAAGSRVAQAQTPNVQIPNAQVAPSMAEMDRDLLEVTMPQLEKFYATHKYTVTQVVQWHIARIEKYNGIYRAVQNLDLAGALKTAAREDAEALAGGDRFEQGPMWGVPIIIKANTSIAGLVTTDGWQGYKLPGHELVAPRDATVVGKLKAAGAVIIGQSNMPDFAASDTNRSTAFGRTGNAYDVRFSPGGSSGGTVTAVTSNFVLLGTGTDTGNSIRMPSATSSVVGVLPTRGLVSIAGIAPLDWLLDNTGPIARDVTDAAIALGVMAGEDAQDPITAGEAAKAQVGPYTKYLNADALKGKRFGVPAFVMHGAGIPFQGIYVGESKEAARQKQTESEIALRPETREAFLRAVEGLRAAGATVIFDDSILPDSFAETASRICTFPYVREGTDRFLKSFGPAEYHSAAEYEKATGAALPATILSGLGVGVDAKEEKIAERDIETDPEAESGYYGPRRRALEAYNEVLERLHLDGLVYPATQMPPPDETMPQDGRLSEGPHSDTSWVNMIGVPAVVVPGGFYPDGLPFGLEISARPWHDGDLLGYAYAYEQTTKHRRPPVLVEKGLLPAAR
jgi:Asp-tRNA(Asn)/Glu-tRNA(Gln) amidotransferase A subunit family amidase